MNRLFRGTSLSRRAIREIGLLTSFLVAQSFLVSQACAWEVDHADWYGPTVKGGDEGGSGSYSPSASGASAFAGTQNVFLDFDTATTAGEHVYTLAQRDLIVAGIASIYAPWDFTFSHTVAPVGAFATLRFNDGPAGGLASDIDFRNLALGGSGTINVCGVLGGCPLTPAASVVGFSVTVGAHELGHLVGLRHADSLGPIGFGLSPTGPSPVPYLPNYPGLLTATETTVHTMASPASVGQTIAQAIAPTVLGERSAVKLEFNEVGLVSPEIGVAHGTPATAQPLTLPTFSVPNTAKPGDLRYGMNLYADAEVVTASINAAGQHDWYQFSGTAGDIINAEVMSVVPSRFGAFDIDPMIDIFMPNEVSLVPQGVGAAFNDDEFESLDSTLIDIVLPATGTFYARVRAFSFGDTGNYELYLFRFRAEAVPEPAAVTLSACCALLAMGAARRRGRLDLPA
jgi:hypothetical protein